MSKLNIGIIGCGAIARSKHIPALLCFSDRCEITALASASPDSARQLQQDLLLHATVYESADALLADPSIDVVHICTPNRSHCALAIQALEAGKHVMCEKPMAETYEDACRMLETAKRTGCSLSVSYQNRFRDDSQAIYAAICSGDLGRIYYAKAHATRRKKVPTWGQFLSMQAQGGGPLIDIGTHAIDLALWFLDDFDPVCVVASTFQGLTHDPAGNEWGPWNPSQFEVEDSAFGFIRLRGGAVLSVEASWALNIPDSREACVTLCGTCGGAQQFELPSQPGHHGWIMTDSKYGALRTASFSPSPLPRQFAAEHAYASMREMQSWLSSLTGGPAHPVRPEQAAAVVRIIEFMYNSARTKQCIIPD